MNKENKTSVQGSYRRNEGPGRQFDSGECFFRSYSGEE